jgi:hypothetical protein
VIRAEKYGSDESCLIRSSPGVPTCRGINKTRTCGKGLVVNKGVRTVGGGRVDL